MLTFVQWLQLTGFFTYLRSSSYTYPIILALHVVGIGLLGAMVMFGNLRLLQLSMKHRTISDLYDQLRVPKRWLLGLAITCGVLLAGSKAEEYYYNAFFRAKMLLLLLLFLHALIFRSSVYNNTAALDRAPRVPAVAKLAAVLSLMLWTGMVIAGRGMGYIEPPLDKLHASLRSMVSYLGI